MMHENESQPGQLEGGMKNAIYAFDKRNTLSLIKGAFSSLLLSLVFVFVKRWETMRHVLHSHIPKIKNILDSAK